MNVHEAAREIGCSVRLVYRLCEDSQLGHLRIGLRRGKIILLPKHVEAYLARCEVKAEPLSSTNPARRSSFVVVPHDVIGAIERRLKSLRS